MSLIKSVFALGACAGVSLFGQNVPAPAHEMVIKMRTEASHNGAHSGGNETYQFMSAEFGTDGKVVKGAPYTAVAVTETTRALADGNRIVNKSSSQLARDSAGRTRREQSIQAMGPWASGKQETMVFINDPEAQTNYVLNPGSSTAHKMPTGGGAAEMAIAMTKKHADEKAHTVNHTIEIHQVKSGASDAVTESLGTKMIEGVMAEGTRYTRTIPVGQIGNERPIEIVGETWTSPDLQTIVMSRHNDPQMGETIYRLTNIQRAEPDPALFAVPSNYTMEEGGKREVEVRRIKR